MLKLLISASGATASPTPPRPASLFAAASHSLDARAECVPLRWEDDDNGNPRAVPSVAIELNGRPMRLQVDTGADTTILYGDVADAAGWSKPIERRFRPATFRIDATRFDRSPIYLARDVPSAGIDGTLGLPALVGRVTVIDYPGRRLCLFAEAGLPPAVGADAHFVAGSLHDGKLFVPAQIGGETWRDVMFDTGSSAMALTMDLDRWKAATGRFGTGEAPDRIIGSAWGKPVSFAGAPVVKPLMPGGAVDLGRPMAFTREDVPDNVGTQPFRVDAILGNAALWNGIVSGWWPAAPIWATFRRIAHDEGAAFVDACPPAGDGIG